MCWRGQGPPSHLLSRLQPDYPQSRAINRACLLAKQQASSVQRAVPRSRRVAACGGVGPYSKPGLPHSSACAEDTSCARVDCTAASVGIEAPSCTAATVHVRTAPGHALPPVALCLTHGRRPSRGLCHLLRVRRRHSNDSMLARRLCRLLVWCWRHLLAVCRHHELGTTKNHGVRDTRRVYTPHEPRPVPSPCARETPHHSVPWQRQTAQRHV